MFLAGASSLVHNLYMRQVPPTNEVHDRCSLKLFDLASQEYLCIKDQAIPSTELRQALNWDTRQDMLYLIDPFPPLFCMLTTNCWQYAGFCAHLLTLSCYRSGEWTAMKHLEEESLPAIKPAVLKAIQKQRDCAVLSRLQVMFCAASCITQCLNS